MRLPMHVSVIFGIVFAIVGCTQSTPNNPPTPNLETLPLPADEVLGDAVVHSHGHDHHHHDHHHDHPDHDHHHEDGLTGYHCHSETQAPDAHMRFGIDQVDGDAVARYVADGIEYELPQSAPNTYTGADFIIRQEAGELIVTDAQNPSTVLYYCHG